MSRYHFLAAAVSTAVVATSLVPFNVYAGAKDFTDVKKGNAYYEAVAYLAGQGTIKGYTDGTFKPNRVITRAEVASIVASSMNLNGKTSKNPGFSDVKKGVWYYEAVAALVDAGVFQGKTKNSFMPNEPITRLEFAKVLSLAYGLTENKEPATKFTDVPMNSWYSGYVGALIENQITEGVSPTVFGSNQALTRGQIALFMFRAETQSVKPFIIEKVTDQTITINGSSYKIDPSLAAIFNKSNENALKNAKIKFVEKAGVITSITYLELTNNGSFNAAVELNAHGAAIAGDLKISADYVLLSNLVVKGNFDIGTQVQNRITADHVTVEGKTTIASDGAKSASLDKFYKSLTKSVSIDELQMAAANELSHVILESSKLKTLNVNKANVSIEATGSTVLNEVNISANASISATSGVTVNKVNLQIGAHIVGISGSINQLNIFNTENVLLNGNAIINELIVQQNGNNRVINLDFDGRIEYLEITDPNAKIILKVGLMIGNIVLPKGSQLSNMIQNYDDVKKFIEEINGVLNPDLSPVPKEPGLQQAIVSANLTKTTADLAKTAHIEAYGSKTDKTYVAVETSLIALEKALTATFVFKSDIQAATANLVSAVTALQQETEVLIAEMKEAIGSANEAIVDADLAKTAYRAAYGLTTDETYVAVEAAVSELETTVNATFKVRADIDTATANLASAVAVMEADTQVLINKMQQAIESADLAIADADVAKAAYSAAYGLTTDTSYVAVETAISDLKTAVNAEFKVRANIDTATANLVSAVAVLKADTHVLITEMQRAIESANLTIADANLAQIAYSAAYGSTTDASYVAVETAIAGLETAVNAEFKVRTNIETATANLSSVVAVLNDETAVLVTEMQQAIESANLTISDANLAKNGYSAAYGLKTDASYVAVETAISDLETAVNAAFKVRADIETATANLASATAVLTDETAVLITKMQQAIESANLTIANADVAKAAYSAAYGLTTDASYVAVETAISELEAAVNASFKVRANIDTATVNLASATAVLNNETAVLITEMQQAIESANLTIAHADIAKAAYSAAYGLTTGTSYVAVESAISKLETAVNATFKVRADIDTATANLASVTAVLNNETAVLITEMQVAIDSANTAFGNAVPAKAAYKVAYGLTTDALYVAVETAEAELRGALNASFKVRADIDVATANLSDAIATLEFATATLITEMQQAIESANVAFADADLSKSAYSAAYGLTTDASYAAVQTAISELETVVNASFKVRADIDAATANLVSAVSILKAETQVLITKMEQAIVSANLAIHEADLVKTAYLAAYGLTTDMSYVAVETAISELETVLNASFKVRADIDLATTNLVSAFTVLNEETAVLITEMQAAIANANTAINSADTAKTAHIKAYGFTIDESYIAVETAIAELKTTVNASFKVKADIDEATANLVSAVTVLQNETAVLITEMQQAIESATVAIADAEAAKMAYTNAFGLTTDKTYKKVVSAIADLKTALNAKFKTKTYIDLATENLLDIIPELNDKTAILVAEMEVAIASANTAIADANVAKAAYSAAFGYTTDASYVAVETALAKLETAVNASFKVRTDIDAATTNLLSVIPALNDETAVLIIEMQLAIDSANLAVADADSAKAAYSVAYGLTTDPSYVAVETALAELETAVNATFKVRADIETATVSLLSAVTVLNNETAILITEMQQAINSANLAIDESDLAKAAYSAAYGLTTDASYVAVETAVSELEAAMNAPFKVRTAIDTATANLLSKVSVLNDESAVLINEMQQALDSANLAVADANLAKVAYSAAYGLTTDASYVAVETAISELATAVNATFKVRADIETAIANLESAVTVLTDETAVLKIEMQQAIESANLTIADANLAKVAYSAAYGLTTDVSYTAVETAITDLATAINAPFKVRTDIETATANLSSAVTVLNDETAVLITQMDAAIASANTAFDNAVPAKTAYKVAYGLTTDSPYVAVVTAEAELRVALDAPFKVRAKIDAATANLNAAIVTLEASTETMITEMAAAIATANIVIENADTAKTAHINAFGYTVDASYVAVETAIAELETAVNASFKVKADIDSATANLVTAVTVLQNETAVLIADLQQAIVSANAAIEDAEAAKTAYTNAFGLTTDKTYAEVVSAISKLKTALNTPFKVTTYIELATDNLIEAIADLNEKTAILVTEMQAAVDAANTAITSADAAKTAYTVAGGLTTDGAYTTFEATVTALQTALNASPKVKVDIQSGTNALIQETPIFYKQALSLEITSATTLVNGVIVGTGVGQIPQAAVDAFTDSIADAQVVYDLSTADYSDVETAISELNNAEKVFMQFVDITPPEITSVTYSSYRITLTTNEKLKVDYNINNDPSTLLVFSKNGEFHPSTTWFYAQYGHIVVSQQGENQIIIDIPELYQFYFDALPESKFRITVPGFRDMAGNQLTINNFVVSADPGIQDALEAARTAITNAASAKTAHTANGGLAIDTAYVEVETSLGLLQTAMNASPKVKADIEDATASLTIAVTVLETETENLVNAEMQAAVDAANTAITNADITQTAYTDAGGTITDAAYVTVETAVVELQVALSASPKVKVDIKSKTDALNQAKTALEIQVSRLNLNLEITTATSLVDAAVIGTEEGQYSQASVDALYESIEEAQAVYDQPTATNIELNDTIAELNQAVKVFKQSVVSPYTVEILPTAQLFINSNGVVGMGVEITTGFNSNYYSKRNIKDLVQVKRGNEVQTLSYNSTTNAFDVLNNKYEVTGELSLSSTTSLIQIARGNFGAMLSPHADLTESTPAGLIYHLKIDGVEVATQTMDLVVDETPPKITSGSYSEGQITLTATEKLWHGEVPNYTVEFSSNGTFEDTQYVSNTASTSVGNKTTIQILESLNIQPASKFRIVPNWVRDYANNYMTQSFEFVVNPGLQQSIIEANAAIANAGIAKAAFKVANGLTTDAAYVAVETKITTLTSALAAKPNVKTDIDTATAELSNAIVALEAETERLIANLQQAISNANTALSDAADAKMAYTDANGLASEAVYVAVDTKRTALELALAATPKVKADIEAATDELSTAIVALETETALLANLQQAIDIANMLMIEAANAQAAYTAADGLTSDPVYVALETKIATLASVLAETPKSLADIEAATVELSTAIVTIEAETERLIAALQQAINTANTVIKEAGDAKTAFTASNGLTTDLAYVDVETKVTALKSALAAKPKVKADIAVSATTLTQAVNDLVKAVLTLEITHATTLSDAAIAGTSTGIYLQESSDDLAAAITIAQKQVNKTNISIDELRESTLVLVEAVADFQKSSIVTID